MKPRIDRLHVLYELALEIHEHEEMRKRFSLDQWAGERFVAVGGPYYTTLRGAHVGGLLDRHEDGCVTLKEGACGTTACMIGWAGSLKVFNDEGFCLVATGDCHPVAPLFHATGATGWPAVAEFFGLDGRTVYYLFHSEYYPTAARGPLDVAKRIKKVIEELTEPSAGVTQ